MKRQTQEATDGVAGGKDSLSDKVANYTRLQPDSQLADKQLASTMAVLENTRAEAQHRQLYPERLVQPNQPDMAVEPKRLRRAFEIFALGMLVQGVLSLVLAGVREHHD